VIAKSFARIHAQNLVNFGVLPLTFVDADDYDRVDQGDRLAIAGAVDQIRSGGEIRVENRTKDTAFACAHTLSSRQVDLVVAGSLIGFLRERAPG
jgi:aconitate hydratase